MKSPWWIRLQVDLVDDHRAQNVSPRAFRTMINCWCVVARTDGQLPEPAELAWRLRMPVEHVLEDLQELEAAGLMEDSQDGSSRPQGWEEKQPVSSQAAERMRRYRERKRGASETDQAPEATPVQDENGSVTQSVTSDVTLSVTDSVTQSVTPEKRYVTGDALEKRREEYISPVTSRVTQLPLPGTAAGVSSRLPLPKGPSGAEVARLFSEFWKLYPKRVGEEDARKAFAKHLKGGADAADIMAGLRAQLPAFLANETKFIPEATKWLNGKRWRDEVTGNKAATSVEDDLPTVTGWNQ